MNFGVELASIVLMFGDKLPQLFALPIQGIADLLLLVNTGVLPFLWLYK